MEPQEIATQYDQIAERWQRDLQGAAYGVAQLERAIQWTTNRAYALDVGCGSSGRFIDLLTQHGFAAEGLDVSAEMIRYAKQLHPEHQFYVVDIRQWQLPKAYSLIVAWDSIFHLPLEAHEAVLTKLCHALEPNGVLLFTGGGGHTSGEITGSFHGLDFAYSTLGVDAFLHILMAQGCTCRHLEYDQHPENHVVLIAQRVY